MVLSTLVVASANRGCHFTRPVERGIHAAVGIVAHQRKVRVRVARHQYFAVGLKRDTTTSVKASEIATSGGPKLLREGQTVEFEVGAGDRGPQALRVRVTGESSPESVLGLLGVVVWYEPSKGYGFVQRRGLCPAGGQGRQHAGMERTAGDPAGTEDERDVGHGAGYAPKPHYRPLTKFENRGIKLGHGVWDLVFKRRAS